MADQFYPDWYQWQGIDAPFHVVGKYENGMGINATAWDEFTAHRLKKYMNDRGGVCKVVKNTPEHLQENQTQIYEFLGLA